MSYYMKLIPISKIFVDGFKPVIFVKSNYLYTQASDPQSGFHELYFPVLGKNC